MFGGAVAPDFGNQEGPLAKPDPEGRGGLTVSVPLLRVDLSKIQTSPTTMVVMRYPISRHDSSQRYPLIRILLVPSQWRVTERAAHQV